MSPLIDIRKLAILLALFAVIGFGSSGVAKADVVYVLNNANFGGFSGPYGTVTVHLVDANTATLTFTADQTHAGLTYLFGNGGIVAANFNGAVTLISSSVNLSEGGVSGLSAGGAGNEDGFGTFSFTMNNTDGFQDAVGGVTFTVDKTVGTWANELSVLTANGNGNVVAAHIFICGADPCNTQTIRSNNPALLTGFVTNGTNPPVPEPASMFLLGSGLVGLAAGLRRRFRK